MSPRELLAVYLECAGPGAAAERARATVPEAMQTAAREFWRGRLVICEARRIDIPALLGAADEDRPDRLAYNLGVRPGLLYALHFDQDGLLIDAGYERSGDGAAAATAADVRHEFGEPLDVSGWWPVSCWNYADGRWVEFRHGVVERTSFMTARTGDRA